MLRLAAVKSACLQASASSSLAARAVSSQALNEDMPLSRLALAVAEPFSPLLEAIAKENSRTPAIPKQLPEDTPVWVPGVAKIFPCTARFANSSMVREVLVHDVTKVKKPRMSWYNPYDTTWVPSGWFTEGLVADMKYYYGDLAPQQTKQV